MTVPEPTTGATGGLRQAVEDHEPEAAHGIVWCLECNWSDNNSTTWSEHVLTATAVPSPETAPTEGQAAADRAAVERVRALHFRRPWRATDGVLFGQTEFPDRCDHCLVGATWPCSTIRALDGADTPATDAQDGAGEAHATRE